MSNDGNQYRIKIIKNGPYLVSGGVPLLEKIIAPKGNEYEFIEGRKLPQAEEYSLCRCGLARFCHQKDGTVWGLLKHSQNEEYEKQGSSSLCVRGGIPIESSDGHIYEVRNRLVLCRCGESRNKPFCDATHISVGFSDSGQK